MVGFQLEGGVGILGVNLSATCWPITTSRYLDDFPGLVHFIYVDRQFHQMTAPSFNIMSNHGSVDPTLFLREKVELIIRMLGVQSGWLTSMLFLREKVELIIRMLGVQSGWLTPTLFLREKITECWVSSLCDQGNMLFLKTGKVGTQFSWL